MILISARQILATISLFTICIILRKHKDTVSFFEHHTAFTTVTAKDWPIIRYGTKQVRS